MNIVFGCLVWLIVLLLSSLRTLRDSGGGVRILSPTFITCPSRTKWAETGCVGLSIILSGRVVIMIAPHLVVRMTSRCVDWGERPIRPLFSVRSTPILARVVCLTWHAIWERQMGSTHVANIATYLASLLSQARFALTSPWCWQGHDPHNPWL